MDRPRFGTRAVRAGEQPDPLLGLTTPIVRSAPFVFPTIEDLDRTAAGDASRFEYSRMGHPTAAAVEAKLAALEGADAAIVTSSGMAAVTTTYLALLSHGDHVLVTDDGYKRTLTFARDALPRFGICGEWVAAGEAVAAVAAAWRPTTRLVLVESPSNPHLHVLDLPALAQLCHDRGGLLAVDATLASPANVRPLELGADLVIHSATKYLAGHNDVLCGAIAGRQELIDRIRELHFNLGATLDPAGCYLLLRGIKTLEVRIQRQNQSALRIARWLVERPEVKAVYYPGLESHPSHALACRDLDGFGGLLSCELNADLAGVGRFIAALRLITHGTSLGGVESLALHLWSIMHHHLTPQDAALRIVPELVRLSVGLEDPDDLIADLEQALAAVGQS
ncbi:MAG: PLP-dependent transferase [Fimbriimonadaceae bacterium]|nr:PLP-dependent transferase [Fimbriimonadaceae bacterium]